MSTHVPGFQAFSQVLHHFAWAKLDTSRIRVKHFDIFSELNLGELSVCLMEVYLYVI